MKNYWIVIIVIGWLLMVITPLFYGMLTKDRSLVYLPLIIIFLPMIIIGIYRADWKAFYKWLREDS